MIKWHLGVLSLFLLLGTYCVKNPIGPTLGTGQFVFAITDRYPDGFSRVLYIDTVSDSVVDSILTPYQIYGMGLSQNGGTLYLGIFGAPFNGLEIDTRTKATTYFGPNTGIPIPFEKLLINPVTSDFFDASTHGLVYKADSLTPFLSAFDMGRPFDTRRKLFYGPRTYMGSLKILVFDYRLFTLVKVIDPVALGADSVGVSNIVITYDGNKLYYGKAAYPYSYFAGIDLRSNRLVAEHLVNGVGRFGIAPFKQDIYRTDAGGYLFPPPPSGLVQIYSPLLEDFKTPIDISKEPNPCDSIVKLILTDYIVMSPDGRKAYLSMWAQFSVMVIDVRTNTVKKILCGFGFVNSLVTQRN